MEYVFYPIFPSSIEERKIFLQPHLVNISSMKDYCDLSWNWIQAVAFKLYRFWRNTAEWMTDDLWAWISDRTKTNIMKYLLPTQLEQAQVSLNSILLQQESQINKLRVLIQENTTKALKEGQSNIQVCNSTITIDGISKWTMDEWSHDKAKEVFMYFRPWEVLAINESLERISLLIKLILAIESWTIKIHKSPDTVTYCFSV